MIPLAHNIEGQIIETVSLLAEPNRILMKKVINFTEEIQGNTNRDYRIDMTETNSIVLQ